MSATRSLAGRLAWSATAVVALWVVLLTVGANVLLEKALVEEADGALRARAEAAAATVRVAADGSLDVVDVRDDAALDVGTWIFAVDGATVEAPPASPDDVDRQAAALAAGGAGGRTAETGLPDRLRLLAFPVLDGGRHVATVVTSTSLAPYRRLERLAWIGTGVLGVLLLVIVHLVLRANVARALRPVRQMTGQAALWSAGDVDRRFGDAPRPAELDELARTLDGVLDRLAAVLRHERQLSDELSHELRTPLARVQAEIELLRERPRDADEWDRGLAVVHEAAGSMRQILETLMAAARTRNGRLPGRCAPADVLGPLLRRSGAGRPELDLRIDVPADLVAGVDAAVLERLSAPVLDNAVRYAVRRVWVTGSSQTGMVRLLIGDDGPGIAPEHRDLVFAPGWRADAEDGHDGAGLGLALTRRLAAAAGGAVTVAGDGTGAVVAIDVPAG
jgi:signal transduction histidine kinase